MDKLKPLGRRDIFGILLPGAILVLIGAYVLFGSLVLLRLPVNSLLEHEFLVTAIFFVVSYLLGSLLRLFAADDVDRRSSKYLVEAWHRERRAGNLSTSMPGFEKYRAELAGGDNVSDVLPGGFDEWLFCVDEFPYPAWQNRKWQAHGSREVLGFFRDKYRTCMWSKARTSSKDFLNYCKLVVIRGGGPLADEINMAEGLTRFFAGAMIALQLSTRLLGVALVAQLPLVAGTILASRRGDQLDSVADVRIQGFYFVLTLVLLIASRWMCHQIVQRFRRVRSKEATTVYNAFYLHSMSVSRCYQKVSEPVSQGPSTSRCEGEK
jgi:hypothetical protein